MYQYTLNGTEFIAAGDRLFRKRDEEHEPEDIEETTVYLYDGSVVRLEYNRSTIVTSRFTDTELKDYLGVHEFGTAIPLESVTPDSMVVCPQCEDGWVGQKDDPENHFCLECGWGIEDEEDQEATP